MKTRDQLLGCPSRMGTGIWKHGAHWDWQFFNSAYGLAFGIARTRAAAITKLKLATAEFFL